MTSERGQKFRRWLRITWVATGLLATILLILSFQARGLPDGALESSATVSVQDMPERIVFLPRPDTSSVGLVFFPGGMVAPTAYAPLTRRVAEAGYPVTIIRLPFLGRHAASMSDRREAVDRGRAFIASERQDRRWVIAGHSLGGAVASELAYEYPELVASLVLLGTSHPRDVDLSSARFPIVKVLGTEDGVATIERSEENAAMLPAGARVVTIDGANHSQFGFYGPQLLDHRATISRAVQQDRVLSELIQVLESHR